MFHSRGNPGDFLVYRRFGIWSFEDVISAFSDFLIYCRFPYIQAGECACVEEKVFAHASLKSVLVQELKIVNPSVRLC